VIRVYSYFAYVSPEEEERVGMMAAVQCTAEHLNLPQWYMGALLTAAKTPAVLSGGVSLGDQPVFASLSVGGKNSKVLHMRRRTPDEINERLTRDLRRIGQDVQNGEQAIRMYGFRRGGAQHMLNWSGKFELVMRLGDWRPDSDSFLVYMTNMNARGTLRSTLRSYGQDDVTQVVAQVTATYNKWTLGVVRNLCDRVLGKEQPMSLSEVTAFDEAASRELCAMFIKCVLQLRHGREDEEPAASI